jgi:hypothetical protein
MKKSILEIKKIRRVKDMAESSRLALVEYEAKQAAIRKLLKQIEVGLDKHDHKASSKPGGHHWGHVGDLGRIIEALIDLKDRLHDTGAYAEVA